MLSLAQYEDDAVSVSLQSCPLYPVLCSLCPMLQQEEAIFEVKYVHAVWNLDHVHCALVIYLMLNLKVPCPFIAKPTCIPCTN
jgi:hypothetical protein